MPNEADPKIDSNKTQKVSAYPTLGEADPFREPAMKVVRRRKASYYDVWTFRILERIQKEKT